MKIKKKFKQTDFFKHMNKYKSLWANCSHFYSRKRKSIFSLIRVAGKGNSFVLWKLIYIHLMNYFLNALILFCLETHFTFGWYSILYQSEPPQETDGAIKQGNWGEVNEGTVYKDVAKAQEKADQG